MSILHTESHAPSGKKKPRHIREDYFTGRLEGRAKGPNKEPGIGNPYDEQPDFPIFLSHFVVFCIGFLMGAFVMTLLTL